MTAELRHVYYDAQKKAWSVEGFWHHPQHRDYHKNWSGDYVILQEYGNFNNPIQMVKAENFDAIFTLAWEPMRVCQFCGFTRMRPCQKRQKCSNLTDHHLEPEDAGDIRRHRLAPQGHTPRSSMEREMSTNEHTRGLAAESERLKAQLAAAEQARAVAEANLALREASVAGLRKLIGEMVEEMSEIESKAENIRMVLVHQLTEPMRSAFWKGVAIRNIATALIARAKGAAS